MLYDAGIKYNPNISLIFSTPFPDPWLIRKEPKKGKEKKSKKKKKKKKGIDPDSIHSALLASGLGSLRPAFTAPAVKATSTPATGEDVAGVQQSEN